MNSHFRKAHDIKYEKQTRAARTFAIEIEGGRATGAGTVEGGRPSDDDGGGWNVDYAGEIEDSPEADPDVKMGDEAEDQDAGVQDTEDMKDDEE
jgi:hypothetical protein